MNFRKWTIALLLLCFVSNIYAQEASCEIIPSKGVNRLQLGISKNRAVKIVGAPDYYESYSEGFDNLLKLKSNPYNWLAYQIGFDSVYTYVKGSEKYPIYTLYFTNDTLSFMTFSAFIYKKWWVENFYIKPNIKLYSEYKTITDSINSYFLQYDYSQGKTKFTTNVYFNKGLALLFYHNKLMMIEIFPKIDMMKFFMKSENTFLTHPTSREPLLHQ